MNLRLFSAVLAVFVLAILLSSCGPEPQIRSDTLLQDTSFITGEPCGPPCWRDITPGETSWNAAIALIEADSTLDELQTRADDESEQLGAAWAQVDGDGCCQMFSQDGETVAFLVMQVAPDTPLQDVIETHGEPEYVVGESLTDTQGIMTLFYPGIPMLIYAFVAGEAGTLSAASEVVGFAYMTDDLMQLLIDSTEPGLYAWEGYQSYSDYADGELVLTPSVTMTPSDG